MLHNLWGRRIILASIVGALLVGSYSAGATTASPPAQEVAESDLATCAGFLDFSCTHFHGTGSQTCSVYMNAGGSYHRGHNCIHSPCYECVETSIDHE